ncbi:MAG: NADH-quinone oxidoreductase subunit M [Verrucomicrobiota bacterium]|nr:NADH-quinone oxidoreductase subunit M [Verrucomicrobiota bacterium]
MSILTYILGFPLLAALAIAFIPRNYRFLIRLVSLSAGALSLLSAIAMFVHFQTGAAGYQFVEKRVWVEALRISYHVGVDGLNVGLVLMAAIVAFAAICAAYEIKEREKEFYLLLMIMISGVIGTFASLDLFFFFFFHELALIPTFIMIGVWGRGEEKNYATFNITLYLSLGGLIALIGLIALYLQSGANSFDIVEITTHLQNTPLPEAAQKFIFPFLLLGFGILVSLWPFHTWAPLGYGAAPTATAMLHAGVLKKFGLYGLLRIAIPLLPQAASFWLDIVAWLCLGNILYCGLVAVRQKDLNLLVGNSSVAHMGFVFLGIASLSIVGVTGAVVIMVAHGLLAALSFALSGYLYNQTGTFSMERMGGLMQRMPFVGAVLIMCMMAGCGLPGFANFVGEAMALFGSWDKYKLITSLAVWGGLVIGAVYMLKAIRSIMHGPMPEDLPATFDAGPVRKIPFALLITALLLFGIFPRLLTDKIEPSAKGILAMTKSKPVAVAPLK